jgi:hypothetical protein
VKRLHDGPDQGKRTLPSGGAFQTIGAAGSTLQPHNSFCLDVW